MARGGPVDVLPPVPGPVVVLQQRQMPAFVTVTERGVRATWETDGSRSGAACGARRWGRGGCPDDAPDASVNVP